MEIIGEFAVVARVRRVSPGAQVGARAADHQRSASEMHCSVSAVHSLTV